jgi:hypothetical protein
LQGKSGSFGYAINLAVAGKYRGDIKDEKAILFFESTKTIGNYADDPKTGALPGGKAVTVKGEILTLPN